MIECLDVNSVTCFFRRSEHTDGLSLSINRNTRLIRLRGVRTAFIEVEPGLSGRSTNCLCLASDSFCL